MTTVDVCQLADDLRSSFDGRLRPIINGASAPGISAAEMQKRLNEIEADNVERFRSLEAVLAALPTPAPTVPTGMATISGLNVGVTASSASFGTPPPKLTP